MKSKQLTITLFVGLASAVLVSYLWKNASATQLSFPAACECANVLNWERANAADLPTTFNMSNQNNPAFVDNGNCMIITDFVVGSDWDDCECDSAIIAFTRADSTGTTLSIIGSISIGPDERNGTINFTSGIVLQPTEQIGVASFGLPAGTAVDVTISGFQATP